MHISALSTCIQENYILEVIYFAIPGSDYRENKRIPDCFIFIDMAPGMSPCVCVRGGGACKKHGQASLCSLINCQKLK